MANTYDTGDVVRVTGTFTNSTGTTVDPTVITYRYKDPSGNTTSRVYGVGVDVIRSTRGVYYIDVDVDEPGEWHDRWVGTGAAEVAAEHYWLVRPSAL